MGGKIAGKNKTRNSKIRLTDKQAALAKAAIADPNATLLKIGRRAGYEGNDAAVASAAHKAMKSANVQETFRAAMAKHPKLQHSALLKKLAEGLEAKTTKFFAHEGRVIDQEECDDYATRATYLTLATRLQGLQADRLELTGAGGKDLVPAAAQLPPMTKEQLLALLALPDEPLGGTDNKETKPA